MLVLDETVRMTYPRKEVAVPVLTSKRLMSR
jgi:hypothetical protein